MLPAMQAPRRQPSLATAAILALAMALSVSTAMMAGGGCGNACGAGCPTMLVVGGSLQAPAASCGSDARPRAASGSNHGTAIVAAAPQSAPAAWRTLDTPPPAR